MFKLSDILKKYKERKTSADSEEISAQGVKKAQAENAVSLSSVVNKETKDLNSAQAQEIYREALSKAKEVYRPDAAFSLNYKTGIGAIVEKILELLSSESKELIRACLSDYEKPQDYLYGHVVNVTILSLDLGLGLSYTGARLQELGFAAFIHDIGEVAFLDIINKKAILTKPEFSQVKEHPRKAGEILKKFSAELSREIISAVEQEHERLDGSGYPAGLKNDQILEFARIISVADVYEAMIHQRPYRAKYTALETVKVILNNKNAFDCKIIKTLIERIGIFPVGILVRLNTKETAVVLRENPGLPLRPVVKVLLDASGKEISEPKQIDLAQAPVLYIEECMECVKK